MRVELDLVMSSAPAAPWLSIIGVGEDGVEGLTAEARQHISEASLVVGGRRHLALVAPLVSGETMTWASPLTDSLPALLARRGQPVAVLATGDPFYFGVGATLARQVAPDEMRVLPQPSCFALAAARLGLAQQDCTLISLAGRPLPALRSALQPGETVLVLSADAATPRAVATALASWGLGGSRVTVLEALGGPRERIRVRPARDFDLDDVDPLNLLAIEVVADAEAIVIPKAPGLPDDWLEHDGQLTKREIRAVTLSSLRPMAGALLWDVGCGSGSVSIEWLLAHPRTRAIAIDSSPERAARAIRNAERLGVPRLEMRCCRAPACLADLPPPQAVFLGGGMRETALIDACWAALSPGGRLVTNAIALESQQTVTAAWQRLGGTLTRLSVERLGNVGRLHAFRPAMPVLHWTVVKPSS